MDDTYAFTGPQSAFLDALKAGRYSAGELTDYGRKRVSLQDQMPPVYQQSMRGTCVANAATALLEYYEDRKVRLSVQFLYEMTKAIERKWLDSNLKALEENHDVDAEFAAKFPAQVAQIRLTTDANGAGSPAAKAFLNAFSRQLGAYFNDNAGSQIKRCFEAIREYGTCRYSLWPYANMQVIDSTAGGALPPGSLEDAAKHRVLTGLYLLRSPNNVDEIRGIVAGANGRRPMPVCVGLPIFEGCDNEQLLFPATEERDGRLVSCNAFKGVHEMLIVGFEEDKMAAGGGWFIVRNSWGEDWGKNGYGRVPYAYVECFCTEAGTILQDMVDYAGDGYGRRVAVQANAPEANVDKGRCGRSLRIGGIALSGVLLAILAVVVARPVLMKTESVPIVADDQSVEENRLVEEKRIAEEKRREEEDRLARERVALEAEKMRIAAERRQAEERATAEAKANREAEEKAAAEMKAKREEEERRIVAARAAAEAAEKARLAEEKRLAEERRIAEEKRLAAEAEERRLAEDKLAAERAKTSEYLVHVTIVCLNEGERDAVVQCLNGLSDFASDNVTNSVGNVTVAEYESGRNLIGIVQKGYRVRFDVRTTGPGSGVRKPTDEIKRILGRVLNERCQVDGEDRVDWTSFTRMSCQQDFSTARGHSGLQKKSTPGVRIGF